jgi:DegV family protein with EDD domain
MGQVKIVTDTTCDLPQDIIQKYDIRLVPMSITLGDNTYKELIELPPEQFYDYLSSSPQRPTSAPPSRKDFSDAYTKLIQEADEVLSIHISKAWTPTPELANNMARFVMGAAKKQGKDMDITVIDSLNTSIGLGMIVIEAAQQAQAGKNKADIVAHITPVINNIKSVFMVDDISYLEKSGRIGKAVSTIGGFLKLKPILSIEGGETSAKGFPMGSESAYDKIIKVMGEAIPFGSSIKVGIAHAMGVDKIAAIKPKIQNNYNCVELYETYMGSAVGATVGPGSFGIEFYSA